MEIIQATIIRQNQALRLRARKECQDRDNKEGQGTGRGEWGGLGLRKLKNEPPPEAPKVVLPWLLL